jgi:hypothetical protein
MVVMLASRRRKVKDLTKNLLQLAANATPRFPYNDRAFPAQGLP